MPRFHQRYDATLSMVWSSLNLEERFKTHKSSIWTVKIGFGVLESHLSAKIESLFWWAFLSELFWSLALIEVNSWSDWVAILGARLGRIDLHSKWRLDLEFGKMVFQSENLDKSERNIDICHSNKDLIIGRNINNLDICKCQGRFKLFLTLA